MVTDSGLLFSSPGDNTTTHASTTAAAIGTQFVGAVTDEHDLEGDIALDGTTTDLDALFEEELNIRRVFIPRPGRLFVRSDYSQLEVRIVAHYSNDPDLIGAILQGGDMHSIIAHKVFKLDCEISEVKSKYKKYRSAAKAIVFGLIYGITAIGLSAGLNIPQQEAQGYIDAFFDTYPGLKTFLGALEDFAARAKFVYNVMGRKRRFLYVNNRALRQGKNFPVQSTASDVTTNAMVMIDERIARENLQDRMQILMQIHDEILTECDIPLVDYCKTLMQECMQSGLSRFGVHFAVPLLTDPGVDYAWGFPLSTGNKQKPGAKEDEFAKLTTLRNAFNGGDQHTVDQACHDYYVTYFRELSSGKLLVPAYATLPGNTVNLIESFEGGIAAPTGDASDANNPFWFRRGELQYLFNLYLKDPDYDIYRAKFPCV